MSDPRPEAQLIGRILGGARIVSIIGGGGMGVVYRGVQEQLGAPVAVKVIRHGFGEQAQIAARFEREAREIAKLRGRTPNVVQIYDFGRDAATGAYFIVMELVEGEGADRLLRRHGRLPETAAARLVRQAAAGLEVAREFGIVHRDIKPENLLVAREGVVKITDFGLAKRLGADAHVTASGQILGTPAYMSPQQAEGVPVDHRSDVYSLGATFFTMLTGSTPFKADTPIAMALAHIRMPVPDPAEADVEASPGVVAVVRRMMAKDPDERFQTAGEVVEALDAVLPPSSPAGSRADLGAIATLVQVAAPAADDAAAGAPPPTRAPSGDLVLEDDDDVVVPPSATDPTLPPEALGDGETIDLDIAGSTRAAATPSKGAPARPARRWWLVGAAAVALLGLAAVLWPRGERPTVPAPGPSPAPAARVRLLLPEEPLDGAVLPPGPLRVRGRLDGERAGLWVRVAGTAARLVRDAYVAEVSLAEGPQTLAIQTGAGDEVLDTFTLAVTADGTPPALAITEPAEATVTAAATIVVRGTVADATLARVTLQAAVVAPAEGAFSGPVPLAEGVTAITVVATDRAGLSTERRVTVTRDSVPPELTLPDDGVVETTAFELRGLVTDATAVRLTAAGAAVTPGAGGAFRAPLTLAPGPNAVAIEAVDAAGNRTARTLTIECRPLPAGLAPGEEPGTYRAATDGALLVRVDAARGPFVDRDEVTVGQYARFLAALAGAGTDAHAACHPDEPLGKDHTPRDWAGQSAPGRDGRPVVGVDWWDAVAYARWAGRDLPTADEWTAAAGGAGRAFPWGDAAPAAARAVFGQGVAETDAGPAPAGGRRDGAAPCGARDLSGNVAEWCLDADGDLRAVRGGHWADAPGALALAVARREHAGERMYTLGFRCVRRVVAGDAPGGGGK